MQKNIFKRLGYSIRYLLGQGVKAISSLIPTWDVGRAQYPEVNFYSMAQEGYRRNELIYSCLTKTARASSYIRPILKDDNDEIIDSSPILELLANPWPGADFVDLFYSIIVFQKLSGRAIYEKVKSRGSNKISSIRPLRPDKCIPIPGPNGEIALYEYRVGSPPYPKLKPDEVLDFKLFDPLNRYHGWPPIAVLVRSVDVDNAITDYYKILMSSGGVPPGYLKVKTSLKDDIEADAYRDTWERRYGGYMNWRSPAVLDNEAEYMPTGFSVNDLGLDSLDTRNEARICSVMEVPPIIVGAKVGLDRSTFANYQEARASWWEDTLLPMFYDLLSVFTTSLLPHYYLPGEAKLDYDLSNVPALRDDVDKRWLRVTSAVAGGFLTVNEARGELKLEDIGPTGDIFLRSMNMIEVPEGTLQTDLTGPVPEQLAPAATDEEEPEDTEDTEEEDKSAKASRGGPPDERLRRKQERTVKKDTGKYFSAQLDKIMSQIEDEYPGRR